MVPVASGTLSGNGTKRRKTIFVVGLGMVGIAFIEKMLKLDEAGEYHVQTCGEEDHLAYNRVGLTEYFEHRVSRLPLLLPRPLIFDSSLLRRTSLDCIYSPPAGTPNNLQNDSLSRREKKSSKSTRQTRRFTPRKATLTNTTSSSSQLARTVLYHLTSSRKLRRREFSFIATSRIWSQSLLTLNGKISRGRLSSEVE